MMVVEGDTECAAACVMNFLDIEKTVSYCDQNRICVQAGGNLGYWPLRLSAFFQVVYTFEPDPYNFACLAYNTRELSNVIRIEGALGDCRDYVGMKRFPQNVGAHQVSGHGAVPVFTVDELNLPCIDLLYLDIEGYEPRAILGALRTISQHKPVICIEDKGLGDLALRAEALKILEKHGYQQAAIINRDRVLTCKQKSRLQSAA